jgi:hypothetical protein
MDFHHDHFEGNALWRWREIRSSSVLPSIQSLMVTLPRRKAYLTAGAFIASCFTGGNVLRIKSNIWEVPSAIPSILATTGKPKFSRVGEIVLLVREDCVYLRSQNPSSQYKETIQHEEWSFQHEWMVKEQKTNRQRDQCAANSQNTQESNFKVNSKSILFPAIEVGSMAQWEFNFARP